MRILLIEDEPDLLYVLAQALREDGYAVDEAADGEDGLHKALSWEYDAVVLDLMLPRLDGWSLLRKLRQARKTPVLILTARDAVADRVVLRAPDQLKISSTICGFSHVELAARRDVLVAQELLQHVGKPGLDPVAVVLEHELDLAVRFRARANERLDALWHRDLQAQHVSALN